MGSNRELRRKQRRKTKHNVASLAENFVQRHYDKRTGMIRQGDLQAKARRGTSHG